MNEEYKYARNKQIDVEIQRLSEEKVKLFSGEKKTEWDEVKEEAEREKYEYDTLLGIRSYCFGDLAAFCLSQLKKEENE